MSKVQVHVVDNDCGTISVTLNGKQIRRWSYNDDVERRRKIEMAHEFVEGWFQASKETVACLNSGIAIRLNNRLCEMQEGCDDSITGFNDAWEVVRKYLVEEGAP